MTDLAERPAQSGTGQRRVWTLVGEATEYGVAHLASVGLPLCWTRGHDAEMVVLRADGAW